MFENICTMPSSVPIMPNAGAQSPIARSIFEPSFRCIRKLLAVTLKGVTDEFEIVTVGDVADSFGEERLVGIDLFQPDRTLL